MVQTATSAGKRVILCTVLPVESSFNTSNSRVVALNDEIVQIADDEEAVLADLYSAINENRGAYLSADGLHPTSAGYRRMAERLAGIIRDNFEKPPAPAISALPSQ
jgi:lysophospholipase L1-like esterase